MREHGLSATAYEQLAGQVRAGGMKQLTDLAERLQRYALEPNPDDLRLEARRLLVWADDIEAGVMPVQPLGEAS